MRPFEDLEDVERFVVRNMNRIEAAFSCLVGQNQVRALVLVYMKACRLPGTGESAMMLEIEFMGYSASVVPEMLTRLAEWYEEQALPTPTVQELEALWNK